MWSTEMYWTGLLAATAIISSAFTMEVVGDRLNMPEEESSFDDRKLTAKLMYKANKDLYWPSEQCPREIIYKTTLENCEIDCSLDGGYCTAFHYHASSAECRLVKCPLPVPEPSGYFPGLIGYSIKSIDSVYRPHDNYWLPRQCPLIRFHPATLERCKIDCSIDNDCTAFHHHASSAECRLVKCPLPVPEPSVYSPGVIGYSIKSIDSVYKAHDKYWIPIQCPWTSIYTVTLEQCKMVCSSDYYCNAFIYHASSKNCQIVNCPLPVPEPSSYSSGYIGYSIKSIDSGFSCPQDFIPVDTQCLQVNTEDYLGWHGYLRWHDAVEACNARNAELLIPSNYKEFMSYVGHINPIGKFWIGASYDETIGTWVWLNGESLQIDHVKALQYPRGYCIMYDSGVLSTGNCNALLNYICMATPSAIVEPNTTIPTLSTTPSATSKTKDITKTKTLTTETTVESNTTIPPLSTTPSATSKTKDITKTKTLTTETSVETKNVNNNGATSKREGPQT